MSCFGGRVPPGVVAPVSVFDRGFDELLRTNVVETSDLHRYVVAANLHNVATPEWAHATDLAKQVMPALCTELVVAERIFTRQQAKCVGLDDDSPVPGLGAYRAVAF